jgi:restriction endonuclease S subunit
MAVWSSVEVTSLSKDFRLDAEHYRPEYLAQEKATTKRRSVELRTVADVSDGNHLSIAEEFSESGVRYLRGQDLSDFFISDADPIYIPEKTYRTLTRSHMLVGDVLVGIVGTIGSVGLVTKRHGDLTGNCKLAIIRARALPAEYIAAYLTSRIGQNEIQRRIRGAVQMGLILPDLKTLPILIPTEKERDAIANLVKDAERSRERSRDLIAEADDLLTDSIGLSHLNLPETLHYERDFTELSAARRMDAEYFSPRYQTALAILGKQGRSMGDVANLAQRRFQPETFKGRGTFQYIEISSLQGDGLTDAEPIEASAAPSRAQWIVEANDVITSTVRPIRRLSALISPRQAGYVCSSGFAVLEPKKGAAGIEPEVLLTFLRLPIICEILDLHTTASMYPAISTARLMTIPIATPTKSIRDKVVSRVRAAFDARAEVSRLLDEAKFAIERMVLNEAK